jgi:hypothetical protein
MSTRNARFHGDPLPDPSRIDTGTDRADPPGGLVPKHHRILDNAGSDPTVVVVVHVRPAHADRGHLDLHLTRPGLRHRPVLDPDVSRSVKHGAWVRHDHLRTFVVRD